MECGYKNADGDGVLLCDKEADGMDCVGYSVSG